MKILMHCIQVLPQVLPVLSVHLFPLTMWVSSGCSGLFQNHQNVQI